MWHSKAVPLGPVTLMSLAAGILWPVSSEQRKPALRVRSSDDVLRTALCDLMAELADLVEAKETLDEHSKVLADNLVDVRMRLDAVRALMDQSNGVYR
jgi:hypothetical protein